MQKNNFFIKSIHIKNYKVFKDTKIQNLSHLCVFLGTNGSGKSCFFDVFGFLHDALQNNVTAAINKRGGIKEVISRGKNPDKDKLSFEIKFYNYNITTSSGHVPIITYLLKIGWKSGKAVVYNEIFKYKRDEREKPCYFIDFKEGEGEVLITNEKEYSEKKDTEEVEVREHRKLSSADILVIKGLGQFEQFKAISDFRNVLENWYVSDFSIDAARQVSDTGVDEHLNPKGNNLAQVTKYIKDNHPKVFDEIVEKLPKRVVGISKVETAESVEGRVVLKFGDKNFKDPFISRFVSDGTIKMFAYLVLLYDPNPHPLLCIEEPENFLYFKLLPELVEEIRQYAEKGGQVFISTHSPDLVNALKIEELFLLKKDKGFTLIEKAQNDKMVKELYKENKLGKLWRDNWIDISNFEK